MDVALKSGDDVAELFSYLCEQEIDSPSSQYLNSYGFLRLPKIQDPISVNSNYPNIQETKSIRHLIDLIPTLNKNLDYREEEQYWKEFYCFPTADEVASVAEKERVSKEFVVNASEKNSAKFRDRNIKIAKEASTNSTNNFVFLSGTTGVGKTTFVKFHTRTQKASYLKENVIISRLKFRDLEKLIESSKKFATNQGENASHQASPLKVFESYLINCLFRDLIESHNVTGLNRKFFGDLSHRARLEAAILEAESMLDLLDQLPKSDAMLLKTIFDLSEGEQEAISVEVKVSALKEAVKQGFYFGVFLDGFDAIEPETIKLDDTDDSGVFLACLEAVAMGSFSGAGVAYQFLKDAPFVFIVSARPITVAQVNLSLQSEVDFRQVSHHSEFLASSRIFDIIRRRVSVRSGQQGNRLDPRDTGLLEAVLQRCLNELRHDYPSFVPGELIKLFNHNVRDKIGFLLLLGGFFNHKLTTYINDNSEVRSQIRSGKVALFKIIETVALSELGMARYELEKILFLNRDEKFSNYFIADVANEKLTPSTDKGSFDNIYNYRTIKTVPNAQSHRACPLLVKREVLNFILEEGEVQHAELLDWLEEFFPGVWSKTDIKLLIRGGMISGEFDSGVLIYMVTEKGRFIASELQYRFAYFERACMAAALPKYVRDRMLRPTETAGGQWGRASIVNVGLFIRYMRMIEDTQDIPSERRLADRLSRDFGKTVRLLANTGFESSYPFYASDLEEAFRVALD